MVHLRTNHSLMWKGIFKKLIVVFVVMFASLCGFAQQYRFVYIQADNQQPFYVKYSAKNYSSSSIGYLILPKLSDGDFSVQIGFPKNLYPEQTFNLSVAGKDLGFALKNFGDKGWGLFNFQTTDIVMNVNAGEAAGAVVKQTTTNNSNPFGNMLADAIHDSTLNQQPVVTAKDTMAVHKQIIDSSLNALKDSMHVAGNNHSSADSSQIAQHISTPNNTNTPTDSLTNTKANISGLSASAATVDSTLRIIKAAETTTNNGTELTFLDNAGKDTIHAFIPATDTIKTALKDTASAATNTSVTDNAKAKTDNPFFNNSNSPSTSSSQPALLDTTSNTGATNSNVITNSNCQKMLSTYDTEKLKKKIISLHNQDEILAAIRKNLRDKCVTTEQVKDLGNLFLSDENRYNFYDAAYLHVSDYFNYPQLQSTLIDTYYKNRFKALLR